MIENKKVEVKTVGEHRPGDVCELKVVRESEMGAFLDAGTGNTSDDILLHKQQQDSPVQVGDIVKVYLYLDPHGRMTASRKLPKMREGQLGYVKVLSVTRDGGFVETQCLVLGPGIGPAVTSVQNDQTASRVGYVGLGGTHTTIVGREFDLFIQDFDLQLIFGFASSK